MSDQESNRIRRIVGWGIVGLIAVIGLSIALSLYYYFAPWRPGGDFDYPFFFFPFHFGWLGAIILIFIVFLVARWFFWAWRRGGRGITHTRTSKDLTQRQLSKRDMQKVK
jgi:hypothetical protein